MMKLPIGAIGGDPKTDNAQDILDEEAEVRWRPKGLPYKSIPSYYYDEEPVHMSLSELGMKEKYNKHSREKERQKRKQKEGKSSSIRQQCSGNSSQVKSSSLSGVKVRDSSLRQTAVHKNPEARRTYPMGMAKSLDSEMCTRILWKLKWSNLRHLVTNHCETSRPNQVLLSQSHYQKFLDLTPIQI